MIASTWTPLFLVVAMVAGMFAQQTAHKFSAASEDQQVGSLAGIELFCSAEGYYLAGHYQPATVESEVPVSTPPSPDSNDEPVLIAAETPPASPSEPPAEPAASPAEPATSPAEPAASPAESEKPADDSVPPTPQLVSDEPPPMEAEPAPTAEENPASVPLAEATPAQPAADASEPKAPESVDAPPLNAAVTEVLPPPTPEQEPRSSGSEFGAFDESPSYVAPTRTPSRPPRPATIAMPGDRTYFDAASADAGRYVTPADLVRERAVSRGEQRRQRIETRKWLGISPLRPTVAAIPYTRVEEPQQLLLVAPRVSATVQP